MVGNAPQIQGRVWRGGKAQDDFEFGKISDYLSEPDTLVWADLCNPDHDTLGGLAGELGLNRWRSKTPWRRPNGSRPPATKPTPSSPSTPPTSLTPRRTPSPRAH